MNRHRDPEHISGLCRLMQASEDLEWLSFARHSHSHAPVNQPFPHTHVVGTFLCAHLLVIPMYLSPSYN